MIETLYLGSYYAYLKGDLQEAKMYYEVFCQEFREKNDPNALSKKQYYHLREVRDAISSNKVNKTISWVNESDSPTMYQEEPGMDQRELVRRIHEDGYKSLSLSLNPEGIFYLYNIEHTCRPYGRVDMVYMGSTTVYPVEVKIGEGRHDLIGQIEKYTLSFRLQLHKKIFEEVCPVTICQSYDSHTLTELKRSGVVTLRYMTDRGTVSVKAI